MSTRGYKIKNKEGIHFITFAVESWVVVFTRKDYTEIVLDSLRFCQQEKGLQIHAWCIMSNHVHLVISAKENNPSEILRDFKKFTSQQIIKAITDHPRESRKQWMLEIFAKAGTANNRNKTYQFWRQDNHPIELFSSNFIEQKLDYIHNNALAAGIVDKAEEYVYSSARDYYNGKSCGLLNIELL